MTDTTAPPRWLIPTCFLLPLVLYGFTAARTAQGGDASELGLLGMRGGVAHPPGYPLYTLLARAFAALPIRPFFFRVALTSAVCGAAAAAVIGQLAWLLTTDVLAALGTALAFAFCPVEWTLAGVPEVFTLHAFLTALVLLLSFRLMHAHRGQVLREAGLLGGAFGLGLSNHLTIVFTGPLLLSAFILTWRRFGPDTAWAAAAVLTVLVLVGMSPYLLLLRWSRLDPSQAIIWGQVDSLRGLAHHFLRREYGTLQLRAGTTGTGMVSSTYVLRFLRELPAQLSWLFFVAAIPGLVILLRREAAFGWGALVSFCGAGLGFIGLITLPLVSFCIEVAHRFFIMPILLVTPFVAIGLSLGRGRLSGLVRTLVLIAALALSVGVGLKTANWRNDDGMDRYLRVALKELPRDAVVLGQSDAFFTSVDWMQRVENVRPDVTYIDVLMIGSAWYYEQIRQRIPNLPIAFKEAVGQPGVLGSRIAAVRPTFVIPMVAGAARVGAHLESDGLLYRVVPPDRPSDPDRARARLEAATRLLGPLPEPADAWSGIVRRAVVIPWADVAEELRKSGRPADAEAAERRAVALLPANGLEE
jgi:hypothetical protein